MQAAFDETPDHELPAVGAQYIEQFVSSAVERNKLQELLWSDDSGPAIPRKQRHDIARSLDARDLYVDAGQFDQLLDRLFVLDGALDAMDMLFGQPDRSLRAEIARHVHRNPGDWLPYELLDRLGAFDCSDRRFRLLLEGLVSPKVRPDDESQRFWASDMNRHLRSCGAELRETDSDGGYPIFKVVSLHGSVGGRPKNLIFASSVKPDLRFRDAVNNDIEIVTNSEHVLVYDRPITNDGLTWSTLQDWWAEHEHIPDDDLAKKSLYRRLLQSLPESPPQVLLFEMFYETFKKKVPELPALLPEVWLHWDPQTVRERGTDALARQRMDFLLLIPGGARVVLEVDGIHHYAENNDRASPAKYARMVAADRDLRLAGYEVFRFGGAELRGDDGRKLASDFYLRLFKRHRVTTS